MEQTKNEPTKENKAAPETGKPKKEREPLTEAQRLKRQKTVSYTHLVLQRGHGCADFLAKRGLCAGEAAAGTSDRRTSSSVIRKGFIDIGLLSE